MTEKTQDKFVAISELKYLNDFLLNMKANMNVMSFHGFLTAIVSSPVPVEAREWMPLAFGAEDFTKTVSVVERLRSNQDAESQKIMDIIDRMRQGIVVGLKAKKEDFYPLVSWINPKLDVVDAEPQNVKEWCLGYLHAIEANVTVWSAVPEILKQIFPLLLVGGTYTYEELQQTLNESFDIEAEKKHCIDIIPQTIRGIYQFWQANSYSDLVKKNVLGKLKDTRKNQYQDKTKIEK